MTREEAIEWLVQIQDKYIHDGDEQFDAKRKEALNMAIDALERTDTHECVDPTHECVDSISRQDAIDQIQAWAVNLINPKMLSREDAIYILESMPSAQPEIIRCRDCKYFAGEGMYCGQNICVQFDHFYCYYGERKE